MKFPEVDLTGLDKSETLKALRRARRNIADGNNWYVCNSLDQYRVDAAFKLKLRIGVALLPYETLYGRANALHGFRYGKATTCAEEAIGEDMKAYRTAWIDHMVAKLEAQA